MYIKEGNRCGKKTAESACRKRSEAGKNGFTFYAAEKGNYKPSELKNVTYKQGDWGSIVWENSELAQFGVSVMFWDNGIDAGFKFFPNRNQMVLAFTSPEA